MTSQDPIVTLTLNPTLDVASSVPVVVPEHKLRCTTPSAEPGGGGINVSRVCQRFGAPAPAVLPVAGSIGSRISELLAAEGLDAITVPVGGETRQAVSITEETTNRQYRFVLPGQALEPAEVEACRAAVLEAAKGASFLVISGSMPEGVPVELVAELIDALPGTRVIVDTSGPALGAALLTPAELVKPSARELSRQVGRTLETESEIIQAAMELFERSDVAAVLASIGAGGAVLVDGDGLRRLRAPTVKVRSAVGAGDSMVAGLTIGLREGRSRLEAARLGVATGTAAVLTPGTELAHVADVERLLPDVIVD